MDIDSESERKASYVRKREWGRRPELDRMERWKEKKEYKEGEGERGSWQIQHWRDLAAASIIFWYIFYKLLKFRKLISNFYPMGAH